MKFLLRVILFTLAFAFLFPWLGLATITGHFNGGDLPQPIVQAIVALAPGLLCAAISAVVSLAVGLVALRAAAPMIRKMWHFVLLSGFNGLAALGVNTLAFKLTGVFLPQLIAVGSGWVLLAGAAILTVIAASTAGLPMKVSYKVSVTTTPSFKSQLRSRFGR
jgi:hypothetical protein